MTELSNGCGGALTPSSDLVFLWDVDHPLWGGGGSTDDVSKDLSNIVILSS